MLNKIIQDITKGVMACKSPKKKSTIKEFISNPDEFIIELKTEGDEINLKIKKK